MQLRTPILLLTVCAGASRIGGAQTPSFIFVRFAAGSAASMYAAYSVGPAAAVFGMVVNPRTGYHELIAGGVARVPAGPSAITFALTGANASDSRYLQLYVVPSIVVHRMWVGGTLEYYQPLQSKGTYDLDVNPATILVRVTSRVRVGTSYRLALAAGQPPKQAGGMTLQVAIPRGAVTVEWLGGLRRAHGDLRASFEAAF